MRAEGDQNRARALRVFGEPLAFNVCLEAGLERANGGVHVRHPSALLPDELSKFKVDFEGLLERSRRYALYC